MLRKSLQIEALPSYLWPWDRRKCVWIANSVILQCLMVYAGSATVLECVWYPYDHQVDFNKLARIMYLYDYTACNYKLRTATALSNLQLPNETYGLNIRPIKWKQALVTVSTRLSSKTRRYIELSLAIHVIWNVFAILMNIIIKKSRSNKVLKYTLNIWFFYSVGVIIFDISMALVYITDIGQSLTKGMVLRYSGWSVELKLKSYDDFAGWLPMVACVLWIRGIFFLLWNIYSCKLINNIRRRVMKRVIRSRQIRFGYVPIPDPKHDQQQANDATVLYFRTGESKPSTTVKKDSLSRVF